MTPEEFKQGLQKCRDTAQQIIATTSSVFHVEKDEEEPDVKQQLYTERCAFERCAHVIGRISYVGACHRISVGRTFSSASGRSANCKHTIKLVIG